MPEKGVVLTIEKGVARVRVQAESAEACKTCSVCGEDEEGRFIDLEAPPGLESGQRVEFEVTDEAALGPAVIVFLLPVIAIIAGAMLGWQIPTWLKRPEYSRTLFGIIGALLLLGASALLIRWYDRAFGKRDHRARIVRILD